MGSLQSLLTKSSDFITPERRRKNFAKKKMSKFIIIFVVYLSFSSTDGKKGDLNCNTEARLRVKRGLTKAPCEDNQKSCKFTWADNKWKAAGCGPEKAAYAC